VFGNKISQTGNSSGNLGFQSKYFDTESGMYYYYNRYYKPDLGRFLNEDPISLNGGLNLYEFVGNNSINFIDPYGEIALSLSAGTYFLGKAIVGVGGVI